MISRAQVRAAPLCAFLVLLYASCTDAERPFGPGGDLRIAVGSDPQGAEIFVDGRRTDQVTPDTVDDIGPGRHEVEARLEVNGLTYFYRALLNLTAADSVTTVFRGVYLPCRNSRCWDSLATYHTASQLRFASNPAGSLFHQTARGDGMLWPATSSNRYASVGLPLFAAVAAGTTDTLALGIYDLDYVVGRPPRVTSTSAAGLTLQQTAWVFPPEETTPAQTIRGLEIEQTVVGRENPAGTLLIRLVFRNVSDRPAVRGTDRRLPVGGITFESAYVGFGLDADIGTANDDVVSYSPGDDLVIIYDGDMRENAFGAESNRPGIVGLRVVSAPAGAGVVLNGFRGIESEEWSAGLNERQGWGWLSGVRPTSNNHSDPRVGFVPTVAGDFRAAVSAGPLRLAPGDSAALTVAVVVAPPVEGNFTSGQFLAPGEPFDEGRALARAAATLIARARGADALLAELP